MTPLAAVLAALAVYRLTLLVTADDLTAPLRARLVDRLTRIEHRRTAVTEASNGAWSYVACACGDTYEAHPRQVDGRAWWQRHHETAPRTKDSRLVALVQCAWCASPWLGWPVVASAVAWGEHAWWQVTAGGLAASAVAGFLASFASPGE